MFKLLYISLGLITSNDCIYLKGNIVNVRNSVKKGRSEDLLQQIASKGGSVFFKGLTPGKSVSHAPELAPHLRVSKRHKSNFLGRKGRACLESKGVWEDLKGGREGNVNMTKTWHYIIKKIN